MSTLENTVSMLEAMPEERLKEVIMEPLTENAIVGQLTTSMEKSDICATIPAGVVSQKNPKAADN